MDPRLSHALVALLAVLGTVAAYELPAAFAPTEAPEAARPEGGSAGREARKKERMKAERRTRKALERRRAASVDDPEAQAERGEHLRTRLREIREGAGPGMDPARAGSQPRPAPAAAPADTDTDAAP
ncbi:MAG: hypothetical protein H6732_11425 [Alphaproteobacteria bacterium]|nr:hypothetical protein [Alphaproteobacteria bacterium]